MKITVFILMISLTQVSASVYSQATKLNMNMKNAGILEILDEIKGQSEFNFLYRSNLFDEVASVDLKFTDASAEEILNKLLIPQGFSYEIIDNVVVIRKMPEPPQEITKQQERVIKGTIIDETGEPIPGVNIRAKGYPDVGTITDMNGDYSLSVPEDVTSLVFSFIGFKTREIRVGDKKVINVKMRLNITEFNEVVVNALGYKEDKDKSTMASTNIPAKLFEISGTPTLSSALMGKSPGLEINQISGDPGAGASIRIRGGLFSALGDTQPLIVLDGIEVSNSVIPGALGITPQSRLNDINPMDIESVEILRGAAAASLWGSKGVNGVLVITTKQGLRGQPIKVDISSSLISTSVNRLYPLQSSYSQGRNGNYNILGYDLWGERIADRAGGEDEFDKSGGYFISDISSKFFYPMIKKNSKETFLEKRKKQLFPDSYTKSNNITVTGGIGDKGTVYFNLNSTDLFGGYGRKHYNKKRGGSLNMKFDVNDKLTVGSVFRFNRITSSGVITSSKYQSTISQFYRNAADFDITDYIGTYYADGGIFPGRHRHYRNQDGQLAAVYDGNPLFSLNRESHTSALTRFISSTNIRYRFSDWLRLELRGGIDAYYDNQEDYKPLYSTNVENGMFATRTITESKLSLQGILRVQKNIGTNQFFSADIGYNISKNKQKINDATAGSLAGNFANFNFLAIPQSDLTFKYNSRKNGSNRLWYNLKYELWSQIYASFNGSFESTSKTDQILKTVGVGIVWQFSKLPLFEDSFLDFGKMRLSYGIAGSPPNPYTNVQKYITLTTGMLGAFERFELDTRSATLLGLTNSVKNEIEIGLDFRLFDNRLKAEVTYYANKIKDDIMPIDVSVETGFEDILLNAVTLQNKGVEIGLSYDFIKTKSLRTNFFINASKNKNEVLEIFGDIEKFRISSSDIIDSYALVGKPLGYLFSRVGFNRDEDGNYILDDHHFPKYIREEKEVGNPHPDWTGSFGFSANYKDAFFHIRFNGTIGGIKFLETRRTLIREGIDPITANTVTPIEDITNAEGRVFPAGVPVRGNLMDWDGDGPAPTVLLDEAWYRGRGYNDKDHLVVGNDHLKLLEVGAGYIFRPKKWPVEYIRLSLTANNLAFWTFDKKAKDTDPQVNSFGVGMSRGTEHFTTPTSKLISFNISMRF